ncbi:MAG: hypothetical protein H0X26_07105 [Alphaproteobacteria bacterium]|nr:hypothetical protein [Alphaproteobacteria bacterium]
MKFLTLTSTLALGLMVAGSETLAMMDPERDDNGAIPITQTVKEDIKEEVTEVDILTQSMIDPQLVLQMMGGFKTNASEGDKAAAELAAAELKKAALSRKKEKSQPTIPTSDSLTKEEATAVSWFAGWFTTTEKTEKVETTSSTPLITGLDEIPVEEKTESSSTPVNSSPLEKVVENTEALSGYSFFKPWTWFKDVKVTLEITLDEKKDTAAVTDTPTEQTGITTDVKNEGTDQEKVD